jgi:molybdopterin molybdotransferase
MNAPTTGYADVSLGFSRLVPLAEAVTALVAACIELSPLRLPLAQARGRVTATSVVAQRAVPDRALALRDGWAVRAEDTLGASSQAPSFAMASRVRIGEPMPEGTDAVLPLAFVDACTLPCEILGSVAPFEGVRAPGADLAAGSHLVEAGDVLRLEHLALLELAGVTEIEVRAPTVSIVSLGLAGDPGPAYIAALAEGEGAGARVLSVPTVDATALAQRLAAQSADLVILFGDSSCGGTIAAAVRAVGRVLAHGIAVRPGETMGCGVLPGGAGGIPIVFAPVRLECALAAWLLLARPCLERRAGRKPRELGTRAALSRKIVSAPGSSDLVLLRHATDGEGRDMWEPLATGDIPWDAILRAEAWLVVAPDSEGFPAGQTVFAQGF